MVKLYIPLRPDEIDRLIALAKRERRAPAQQAALLLGRALNEHEPSRCALDTPRARAVEGACDAAAHR